MSRSIVVTIVSLVSMSLGTVSAQSDTLRIIAFGAHPDDCEYAAGGVSAHWAEQGAQVKFVSMTNGDIGHFSMAGGPLARRRQAEVKECAEEFGIAETEVLDIHDGELMPTLKNRRKVVRLIREWNADIVLFHRPYDYHPDHRHVGELVENSAVMVVAKYFEPLTPALDQHPIYMYMHDSFEHPYPFEPDIVVGFDEVAERKWDCIRSMPSQFGDEDSWMARYTPGTPEDPEARREFLLGNVQDHFRGVADTYRDRLVELYGEQEGENVEYAEAFELCQYGRQVSIDRLKELFPTFE